MRTRFRCVDYFKRASIEGLDNLNFFRLPVPLFPPSNICDGEETCCFDSISSVSLEIERLPVENALSRFFSDVLPHTIDVDNGEIPVTWIQSAYADGPKTHENRRNSTTTATEVQFDEVNSCLSRNILVLQLFFFWRAEEEEFQISTVHFHCFKVSPRHLLVDILVKIYLQEEFDKCNTDNSRNLESELRYSKITDIRKRSPKCCSLILDVFYLKLHVAISLAKLSFHQLQEEADYEYDKEESLINCRSGTVEIKILKEENEFTGEEEKNRLKVIRLETPELDCFLEEQARFSQKEDRQIFSQISEIENSLDMVDFKSGTAIHYPCEISKSVYSVDDTHSEFPLEQRSSCFVEDAGFVLDCCSKFPLLEVNEFGLEFYMSPSIGELHLILENIKDQNWTQNFDLVVDGKDLFGSIDINLLECLSGPCPLELCLEPESTCLDLALEMEFFCIQEAADLKGTSPMHLQMSGCDFFSMVSPVQFQEVEILDLESFQFSEVFANSHLENGAGICDQMLKDNMDSVWNFYESIVNNELALVDDTFKPLPIPVLSVVEDIQLLSALEEVLAVMEPLPPSASDGIYLDWHLLEGETWNLEEIDTYNTDAELKYFNSGMVGIDFVFWEEAPDVSSVSESKEIMVEVTGVTLGVNEPLTGAAHSQLSKDSQKLGIGEVVRETSIDKVTMLFESMSQSNDLDFFLNPKKSTARRSGEPAVTEKTDGEAKLPLPSSSNPTAICASDEVKPQQWDIEVHQIRLSDHILSLVDNFQKSYLTILENEVALKEQLWPFPVVDNFNLLSIKKQNLVDWIKNISSRQTTLACGDGTVVALVTLYAIKQMACYLCFHGIHTAHLYVDNLSRSNKYLRCRLILLQSLIHDAYQKADTEITESHPSLSVIQGILRMKTSQSGSKVLIVADQLFWLPLKRLLNAMGILFHEVQDVHNHADQPDAWNSNMFTKIIMNSMLHSDCLLMSHENVSASLPFNKFNIILEYGGSYSSSKIFSFSPKISGLPHLHFLKVELEDFSAPKALCEDFYASHFDFAMEDISQSISTLNECIKDHKFEEQLNFEPVNEKCMEYSDTADYVEDCSKSTSVPSVPFAMESKQINSVTHYPDIVIVVNTQNFDKEMLIYRRSTYQRILAMEKQGVQVVEREINLPVDLILSAAVCLVLYDCRNIGKKATVMDEASSCITLYVEHIATNILTSLSFAFSSCILIFEGESSFLADIMDLSDALYAAATSLGLDLQLFCSYSAELTDDIIMSCIIYATKLNKGLYPKMFESETLAESFLTSFPSINPLSAHAILTSGGMLVEFLEWSYDRRIQAIGKYHVPDESLALFSALCRYGEREDSKSGMTECSSSVSPAPDSGNSHCKTECDRKRRKYMTDAHTFQMPMEELLFDAPHQSTDGILKPSRMCQPYHSHVSSICPEIFEKVKGPNLSPSDQWFDQKEGLNISVVNDLYWNGNNFENLHGDFKGEVIDLNNSSLPGEDFSIANITNFSPGVKDIRFNPTPRNSSVLRKSLFGTKDLTCLPASLEINFGSDICSSQKDQNQKLEGNVCAQMDIELDRDTLPMKCQREFLKGRTAKGSTEDGGGLLFPDKTETPLSNIIHSSQLQRRSPWTMEFLNRIKEKSKMHQQSLPCDPTISCFGCPGNVQKVAKRSPSVLDGFRYQGGTYPKKIMKQKQQKRLVQPSSCKNGKASASLLPVWTPTDKRARQTLSFARNGNETQSKLVWADGNVHRLRKKLRNEL
ncbi:protein SHORTAGE IN CHIASMATA 1 [Telopea speciosissima]|uniref:protein SHORTAGE IN CHIASMATA 1 n=1 Tax=Telopea speciosissima TaxID=54955 RepID=UPI001CC6316B|nr:protein SHORTAGE IN CHIASMATA 1 [Telopea speciosissima]